MAQVKNGKFEFFPTLPLTPTRRTDMPSGKADNMSMKTDRPKEDNSGY
jgi:hypothetical protein